jgi:hypothetical protein
MDKEYVFPKDNWYLKFTEEERPIVDNWRINIIKFSDKPCLGNCINYIGSGMGIDGYKFWGLYLITIDQFKQYVLNINPESKVKENYDYLIPLIEKL